jgi:hypothetical protein
MRPKVLFLNCHGERKRNNVSHFCFESVNQAGLLEEFSEANLFDLLRNIKS